MSPVIINSYMASGAYAVRNYQCFKNFQVRIILRYLHLREANGEFVYILLNPRLVYLLITVLRHQLHMLVFAGQALKLNSIIRNFFKADIILHPTKA